MSAKSFSLPGLIGFSAPVVRSEHKGETARASRASHNAASAKPSGTSKAVTHSTIRSIPVRRAVSARSISFRQVVRAWFGVGLGVSVVAVSLIYVLGVNSYAATGYEIQKQQQKLNAAQEENKKLMVKTAELGSISQIQDEATSRNLVSITNQEFLQPHHLSQR